MRPNFESPLSIEGRLKSSLVIRVSSFGQVCRDLTTRLLWHASRLISLTVPISPDHLFASATASAPCLTHKWHPANLNICRFRRVEPAADREASPVQLRFLSALLGCCFARADTPAWRHRAPH